MKILCFVIIFLFSCSELFPQNLICSCDFNKKNLVSRTEISLHNLKIYNSSFENIYDSLKKNIKQDKFVMKKSPWRAVAYSAVLPGLGQFYNESYWKIPIIAALGGYFAYEIVKNNNEFLKYRDDYANSQTPANPNGDLRYKTLREFYRDQRDQFFLYAGLLYLVNLFDAYVDAHLFDFDVTKSIKITFSFRENGLNYKINF